MSIANHHRFIAKVLVSTAVVFGALIGASAPASADPIPGGTDPDPFGDLSCSCRQTAPADSPLLKDDIDRGIRNGLSSDS